MKFLNLQKNPLISYKPNTENHITNPIVLSEKEKKIFEIIKETIKINNLKNIELRVVGGWVRDHLLNIPCHDLDITIKGIDTKTFVKILNDKVLNKDKCIINNKIKKQDGTEINLTKTKILDIMIDFIDLSGNVIDDVKKRDFTFNSLYYNIL